MAANRDVFARWADALQTRDFAALDELAHPDFEDFYPQSGEVTRGIDDLKGILASYPGGVEALGRDRIVGGEERWIRTPMFTVLRVEGSEDVFTSVARARYPDGSIWFIVSIGEVRDGRVYRTQTFFAPPFEPPEWRAQWVTQRARPGE